VTYEYLLISPEIIRIKLGRHREPFVEYMIDRIEYVEDDWSNYALSGCYDLLDPVECIFIPKDAARFTPQEMASVLLWVDDRAQAYDEDIAGQ